MKFLPKYWEQLRTYFYHEGCILPRKQRPLPKSEWRLFAEFTFPSAKTRVRRRAEPSSVLAIYSIRDKISQKYGFRKVLVCRQKKKKPKHYVEEAKIRTSNLTRCKTKTRIHYGKIYVTQRIFFLILQKMEIWHCVRRDIGTSASRLIMKLNFELSLNWIQSNMEIFFKKYSLKCQKLSAIGWMPCVVEVFTGLTNVRDMEEWSETKIPSLFCAAELILKIVSSSAMFSSQVFFTNWEGSILKLWVSFSYSNWQQNLTSKRPDVCNPNKGIVSIKTTRETLYPVFFGGGGVKVQFNWGFASTILFFLEKSLARKKKIEKKIAGEEVKQSSQEKWVRWLMET